MEGVRESLACSGIQSLGHCRKGDSLYKSLLYSRNINKLFYPHNFLYYVWLPIRENSKQCWLTTQDLSLQLTKYKQVSCRQDVAASWYHKVPTSSLSLSMFIKCSFIPKLQDGCWSSSHNICVPSIRMVESKKVFFQSPCF